MRVNTILYRNKLDGTRIISPKQKEMLLCSSLKDHKTNIEACDKRQAVYNRRMNTLLPENSPEKTLLSVSQLNRRAKHLLETHFAFVWVSGEISNLAKPSSGHWYFSLKDNAAQVRCAMFKNTNQRVRWTPESGQQVSIRARVSLYEGRGEYQLIVEHMEMSGDGQLQQQYEQLKAKLSDEGLFADTSKKALPAYPQHIGIITSPTGAAVHDILSVLQRRYPISPISIFPVSVQGNNAAPEIINALKKANKMSSCDVIILSRGGGSIEDLWAFNDEVLARTIFASDIPIISAVGHEVDFTIADFVADIRAPTPSVSAEIATPDYHELLQLLDHSHSRLLRSFKHRVYTSIEQVNFLSKRLRHPGERIQQQQQQLNHLQQRLITTAHHQVNQLQNRLQQAKQRLSTQHPQGNVNKQREKLKNLLLLLKKNMAYSVKNKQQELMKQASILQAISPLIVLSRGYSITRQQYGDVIKDAQKLAIGDEISTHFSQGSIISTVIDIKSKK
jgi:exodeoxyribonuclease VII large subunit